MPIFLLSMNKTGQGIPSNNSLKIYNAEMYMQFYFQWYFYSLYMSVAFYPPLFVCLLYVLMTPPMETDWDPHFSLRWQMTEYQESACSKRMAKVQTDDSGLSRRAFHIPPVLCDNWYTGSGMNCTFLYHCRAMKSFVSMIFCHYMRIIGSVTASAIEE